MPSFRRRSFAFWLLICAVAFYAAVESFIYLHTRSKQHMAAQLGGTFAGVMRAIYQTGFDLVTKDPHNDKGEVISSWRFALRFYALEGEAFDSRKPWDDPVNVKWWREMPYPSRLTVDGRQTCVMALTGPGTFFTEVSSAQPTDFDEDTIVLVEVRNSGIHWMQPGDLSIETMPKTIDPLQGLGISGNLPGGFHVAFADGQAWFISNDVPFETLEKFFTREGAMAASREDLLEPYCIRKFMPGYIEGQN